MDGLRLGLVLHPTRDVTDALCTVVQWAQRHGTEVRVGESDAERVPLGVTAVPERELVARSNVLISIGGDGTMLGALRLAAEDPKPVLGINLGRLGFLTEVDPAHLPAALDRLADRDFTIEPHACLRVGVRGHELVAFNDLALARRPGEGYAVAELSVAGRRSGYYRCDAVIVATPSGSTAYSYAAGGPLVSPATESVVITPASPMSGIARPLILCATEIIHLRLLADSGQVAVEIDGQVSMDVGPGDEVGARLDPKAGLVMRLDIEAHQRRSQIKLSLLDLPFLPEQLREILPEPMREEFDQRRP
jgi:NAD+ kinase